MRSPGLVSDGCRAWEWSVKSTLRGMIGACALGIALLAPLQPALAETIQFVPQTKVRVSIVQWMPLKGRYEPWDALAGEFTVSAAGTLTLPVIGSVPVGTMDGTALADEISRRIQEKTKLVDKPDTTIEILRYPPIYVVGDVKNPNQYEYRPGLNVLQALALSGGERRSDDQQDNAQIRLVGELRAFDSGILRASARIARLQTEMSDAAKIKFPPVLDSGGQAVAHEVFTQEEVIFRARADELKRQTERLSDLRDLFNAEIDVLRQKIQAQDASIKSVEDELANVKVLVDKGIATTSRQSELERALAGYRADRLDAVTAVMRARQGSTEASRNFDGLRDQAHTEAAVELQTQQFNLEQLRLKREISQKLLLDTLASRDNPLSSDESSLSFSLTRTENGQAISIPVPETANLMPGDVLKVTFAARARATEAGDQTAAAFTTRSEEAGR